MNVCVFCGSSITLNTQLAITLDDGIKVVVPICDIHAEDATIKTARVAYLEHQAKVEAVLQAAKALGINVDNFHRNGSLLVPAPIQQPAQRQDQQPQVPLVEELSGEGVISTSVLDSAKGMQSVGGNTEHGAVPSYSSHSLGSVQSQLPPDALKGKAKMVMVEGRTGMQIAIPETRIDGTGTTHIKIIKREDDSRLQHRFKRMASESMQDRPPNFAREGYQNSQAECPICRGTCGVRQNVGGVMKNTTCPKCNGAGFISLI